MTDPSATMAANARSVAWIYIYIYVAKSSRPCWAVTTSFFFAPGNDWFISQLKGLGNPQNLVVRVQLTPSIEMAWVVCVVAKEVSHRWGASCFGPCGKIGDFFRCLLWHVRFFLVVAFSFSGDLSRLMSKMMVSQNSFFPSQLNRYQVIWKWFLIFRRFDTQLKFFFQYKTWKLTPPGRVDS